MDWIACIAHNRDALLRMIALWVQMVGGSAGGAISRRTHFAVMRVLRTAESAVRRLVLIEARELAQLAYVKRAGPAAAIPKGLGQGARIAPFALFDPRKNFEASGVRRYAVEGALFFRCPGLGPGPR